MNGWGQVAQCDAVDPAGHRCVLVDGHPGPHGAAPARPRPIAFVVALIVLMVGGITMLFNTVVAYYGLGGARATPGPVLDVMWLGLIVLPAGLALGWIQRRRAAIACVAILLLQIPVGMIAMAQHGPSGNLWSDGATILLFAIPGLLLAGYILVLPRFLDRGQSPRGSTPSSS